VATISSGMPAQRAGLKPGDILVSANGIPLLSIYKLDEIERATAGQPLNLVIVRDGARHEVTVKPEKTTDPAGSGQSRWMIGLTLENRFEIVKLPFARAFVESLRENGRSAKLIFESLERMIERRISPKSLVGPVGIAQLSGETAREGPAAFLSLMCMVSLNLAIFNLLPIPILDGGGILMLFIEMVMRRDMSMPVKEAVFKVGFVFIMMLVAFVLYNDISKILPAG